MILVISPMKVGVGVEMSFWTEQYLRDWHDLEARFWNGENSAVSE